MPSVDSILKTDIAHELESELGRERMLGIVRSVSERVRNEIAEHGANGSRESITSRIEMELKAELAGLSRSRLQRVTSGADIQKVIGHRHRQMLEEDLRHIVVVMLPRMH